MSPTDPVLATRLLPTAYDDLATPAWITPPSVPVALVAGYSLVLLAVAWGFDLMSRRVARRSNAWRTGEFRYHEDHDAWLCPEDQWLWPKSFDPENRVMRYRASPVVCNACPVKDTCTTSVHGREITREYDPWPYSEAGRFHRGISCLVAAVALMMPAGMLLAADSATDVAVLAVTIAGVLLASIPLGRHLWHSPDGFPEHVSQDLVYRPAERRDPYRTSWGTKGRT